MLPAKGYPIVTVLGEERVANTPEKVARLVSVFLRHPVRDLIANLTTEISQIDIGGRNYP